MATRLWRRMKAMGFFEDKHISPEGVTGLRPAVLTFASVILLINHFVQAESDATTKVSDGHFALATLRFNESPARWLLHRYLDVEVVGRTGNQPQLLLEELLLSHQPVDFLLPSKV